MNRTIITSTVAAAALSLSLSLPAAGQLTTEERIDANADNIARLYSHNENARAGVASAVAAASHQFDTNHQGLQLSLSGGYYANETALGLGIGGQVREDVGLFINATTNSAGKSTFGGSTLLKF